MKIVFITDGNSELGLGHVYQSKTLARYVLQKAPCRVDLRFVTQSGPEIVSLIEKDGFDVVHVDDDPAVLSFLKKDNPDVIIFDKLIIEPSFAKAIKNQTKARLCVFTCITEANNYADLSVLADMGSNFKNICEHQNGKTVMRGTKYWIMRPDFYKYGQDAKRRADRINTITLIFGGADPQNYTASVLERLIKEDSFTINVVVGAAYPYEDTLRMIISQSCSKAVVKLMHNISNMAEIMYKSDLVLSSPGLSMFEALKVNTPVVSFWQSELQRDVYGDYIKTFGPQDVDRIMDIIANKSFIYPSDSFIRGLEIGCGIDEIIQEIIN